MLFVFESRAHVRVGRLRLCQFRPVVPGMVVLARDTLGGFLVRIWIRGPPLFAKRGPPASISVGAEESRTHLAEAHPRIEGTGDGT